MRTLIDQDECAQETTTLGDAYYTARKHPQWLSLDVLPSQDEHRDEVERRVDWKHVSLDISGVVASGDPLTNTSKNRLMPVSLQPSTQGWTTSLSRVSSLLVRAKAKVSPWYSRGLPTVLHRLEQSQ